MFFRLSTAELGLLLLGVMLAATGLGLFLGQRLLRRREGLHEPFSVLHTALLGLVGLVLAFGLALAVGRYESRRTTVVEQANAIGTTYLRAQTLAEPARTESLELLVRYTDATIVLTSSVPNGGAFRAASDEQQRLQRALWTRAGQVLTDAPEASAPRLYVETLNEMIDMQTVQVAVFNNRIPDAVLALEVGAAALALGLLSLYLVLLGRGALGVPIAVILVTSLLLVTFDLDRPTRGLITVPDAPLTNLRASMELPPAAQGPGEAA